jgi:hypothetical protein
VLLIPFLLGACSIAVLLLYFSGLGAMGPTVRMLLLPAIALVIGLLVWARLTQRHPLYHRILAGLWAGALATLTYDVVRVPISWAGVPVFKAVSYFGTVILEQSAPSVTSELVGWLYHFSNGVGFGLMYACIVRRPRAWSAVLWGVSLEVLMLLTPYAEVFGYKVSPQFFAITAGSHIVYGFTLWLALRYWLGGGTLGDPPKPSWIRLGLLAVIAPLGVGGVAADFYVRYGQAIPTSPPAYVGSSLYTTWNVLDPDRLAATWVLKRFVDPRARFHFVAPFSRIPYGTPFDTPEAAIRRGSTRAVTEVLMAMHHLEGDESLKWLARMAHLYEITPWRLPSDPQAQRFGQVLMAAAGPCSPADPWPCVERAFHHLDAWYVQASPSPGQAAVIKSLDLN